MYEEEGYLRKRVNTKDDGRSLKAIMTAPPLSAAQHQEIRNKQVAARRAVEDKREKEWYE